MPQLALLSTFLTGLLAGMHCAGMCGGMVTALSFSGTPGQRAPISRLLAYNAGRIASYAIAGALVGAVGAAGLLFGPLQQTLYVLANLLLIALGLCRPACGAAIPIWNIWGAGSGDNWRHGQEIHAR